MHYTELNHINNKILHKSIIRSMNCVLLSFIIYNVGKGLQQIQ